MVWSAGASVLDRLVALAAASIWLVSQPSPTISTPAKFAVPRITAPACGAAPRDRLAVPRRCRSPCRGSAPINAVPTLGVVGQAPRGRMSRRNMVRRSRAPAVAEQLHTRSQVCRCSCASPRVRRRARCPRKRAGVALGRVGLASTPNAPSRLTNSPIDRLCTWTMLRRISIAREAKPMILAVGGRTGAAGRHPRVRAILWPAGTRQAARDHKPPPGPLDRCARNQLPPRDQHVVVGDAAATTWEAGWEDASGAESEVGGGGCRASSIVSWVSWISGAWHAAGQGRSKHFRQTRDKRPIEELLDSIPIRLSPH